MKKIVLKIDGMSCSACSNSLEKHLKKQDGVIDASVNLVLQEANITYDNKKVSLSDLDRFVSEVGFKSLGEYKLEKESTKDNMKLVLIVYLLLLLVLIYISMSNMFNYS